MTVSRVLKPYAYSMFALCILCIVAIKPWNDLDQDTSDLVYYTIHYNAPAIVAYFAIRLKWILLPILYLLNTYFLMLHINMLSIISNTWSYMFGFFDLVVLLSVGVTGFLFLFLWYLLIRWMIVSKKRNHSDGHDKCPSFCR